MKNTQYKFLKNGRLKIFENGDIFLLTNKTEKLLKQYETSGCNGGKYRMVYFYDGKIKRQFYVHRLVGEAFIPNPHDKPYINHIDGNPGNNHISNLEWTTNSENQLHAYNNLLPKYKCRFCGTETFSKLRLCGICEKKLYDTQRVAIDNMNRYVKLCQKVRMIDILQLSETQKELLVFKLVGCPNQEIALRYGVSHQAISDRLKKLLNS